MTKLQDRSKTIGAYSFDEGKHAHKLDGKPLCGVTTVLSVIAKPALIQWAANMACDYIKEKSASTANAGVRIYDVLDTVLDEARSAHRKKKEKAGDVGSEIHDGIEKLVKQSIEQNGGMLDNVKMKGEATPVTVCINNFIEWARENKVKFIESEKNVYSRNLWIGGILDLVVEMDGKRLIADIKTSSGIYNEHFFQMAAYDLCLEEMGEKVDGYLVINLKKTGEFDLKITENKEINREAFKSALSLYKIINSLE